MRKRTNVDNSEHVKAGWKAACEADQCVVKYLPSSDHSQLPKRLVDFHLSHQSLAALATPDFIIATFKHALE